MTLALPRLDLTSGRIICLHLSDGFSGDDQSLENALLGLAQREGKLAAICHPATTRQGIFESLRRQTAQQWLADAAGISVDDARRMIADFGIPVAEHLASNAATPRCLLGIAAVVTATLNWQSLLRPPLAALALPADEQVEANGPGCVACDLLEDFKHAHEAVAGSAIALTVNQRQTLDDIDKAVRSRLPTDVECFDNEVLRRPAWQSLRDLAAIALQEFNWTGTIVAPFAEISPGVWSRWRPVSGRTQAKVE